MSVVGRAVVRWWTDGTGGGRVVCVGRTKKLHLLNQPMDWKLYIIYFISCFIQYCWVRKPIDLIILQLASLDAIGGSEYQLSYPWFDLGRKGKLEKLRSHRLQQNALCLHNQTGYVTCGNGMVVRPEVDNSIQASMYHWLYSYWRLWTTGFYSSKKGLTSTTKL